MGVESYKEQLKPGRRKYTSFKVNCSTVAHQNGTSQPEVAHSSGLTHGMLSDLQEEIINLADSITFYLYSKSINLNSKSGDEIPKHTSVSLEFTSTASL